MAPAGKLDRRITLVKRVATSADELGATQPRDKALVNVWAAVRPLSSREILQAAENKLHVSHEVRIRHTSQIHHADAIILRQTRRLSIESVINPDERDREIILLCNEQQT